MTLGDICKLEINNQDANFWLIRKGSLSMVGKPTKEFSPEHIGVTVIDTEKLYPDFLYYYMMFMHQSGLFQRFALGTLNLKHIRIDDISKIPVQMQ
jgi:hypothetical protein